MPRCKKVFKKRNPTCLGARKVRIIEENNDASSDSDSRPSTPLNTLNSIYRNFRFLPRRNLLLRNH